MKLLVTKTLLHLGLGFESKLEWFNELIRLDVLENSQSISEYSKYMIDILLVVVTIFDVGDSGE